MRRATVELTLRGMQAFLLRHKLAAMGTMTHAWGAAALFRSGQQALELYAQQSPDRYQRQQDQDWT